MTAARATALGLVAALAIAWVAEPAEAGRRRRRRAAPPRVGTVKRDQLAGGDHWRVVTERGPVHVWRPAGFRHDDAGIVVYVHGYYTDVDRAFREHRLAEKFRASKRNALFVVPEAPAGNGQPVFFPTLGELLGEVRRWTKLVRPPGPVIALGHSGAFRTLASWLDYPLLEQVVLIDALYGEEDAFRGWLEEPRARPSRLVMVAADTLRWSEPLAREAGADLERDQFPQTAAEIDDELRAARFVYLRAQYGHMALVENDVVIPQLLRLTDLGAVGR